ncbi:MAG: tRNA pseudouridine(38-40) synthase TruA [Candidatus Hydrogenedentes bacterium]|nr:tRNA pseudouridine(38-40) synthase TruA [Candidatus Hydrogenedentota bacterium]
MKKTTLKCVVRYDGTNFSGWQRQPGERTVQGELERAFSRLANADITIQGSGRTDAGVHALAQVFSCRWPGVVPIRLAHATSRMLSPEIHVLSVEEVDSEFNARFGAYWKRYVYTFDFNRFPDPLSARYAWHVPYRIDLGVLESSLQLFLGTHDFSGFQSAGSQMKNTVRTIYVAQLSEGGLCRTIDSSGLYRIEFTGNGFLYKMVRNMCGTLIEVARGRFMPSFIEDALALGGPFRGYCAPPQGLALTEVHYNAYENLKPEAIALIHNIPFPAKNE